MSLSIRMARYAMESEYAGYGEMGDPGLGSILKGAAGFIGKIGKSVLKVAPKALPFLGAAGAVAGVGLSLLKKKPTKLLSGLPAGPGLPSSQLLQGGIAGPEYTPLQLPGTGIQIQGPFGTGMQVGRFGAPIQRQLPAPGGVQPGQPTGTQLCQLPSGGLVQRRTHANKSGYWLKSGQYVAPGTRCVTNRRMNPLNPRALHHAMTRIVSGKRAAKFLNRISIRSGCAAPRARARSHGRGCKCVSCK